MEKRRRILGLLWVITFLSPTTTQRDKTKAEPRNSIAVRLKLQNPKKLRYQNNEIDSSITKETKKVLGMSSLSLGFSWLQSTHVYDETSQNFIWHHQRVFMFCVRVLLFNSLWLCGEKHQYRIGNFHLNYPCICIQRFLCMMQFQVDNNTMPYYYFRHPYCYFSLLLFSSVFVFLPPS